MIYFFWHAIFALLILFVAERLGRLLLVYRSDYQPLASLFHAEGSVGFNAIFRILIAPVSIVTLAILLYLGQQDEIVTNIWHVAALYLLFNLALILLLGRWTLLSKAKFFSYHAISIALTYYLYTALILKGISHLLPDEANLRTDMWLIIAAFFYGIFKAIPENTARSNARKVKYIRQHATKYERKFKKSLSSCDATLRDILISIMIYEDFNRPKSVRLIEQLVGSKTQGIMQMTDARSDAEGIKLAAEKLGDSYKLLSKDSQEPWEYRNQFEQIVKVYNPDDPSYASRVYDIFEKLND